MAFNYQENINYNNDKPNFVRDTVKTLAALLAVDPAARGYDYGHIVFCEEDGRHYKFNYDYSNPPADSEKDAVTGWFVLLQAETDLSDYYNKSEVDNKIASVDLSDYYNKTEVNNKFDYVEEERQNLITALADGGFQVGFAFEADKANSVADGSVKKASLDAETLQMVTSIDNLETANTINPLSANQGKILNEKIEANKVTMDSSFIADSENPVMNRVLHAQFTQVEGQFDEVEYDIAANAAAIAQEKTRAEEAEAAITDLISSDAAIVETLTQVAAWLSDETTEGEAATLIADVEGLKIIKPVLNAHESIIGIKTVTDIVDAGKYPARLDLSTVPPTVVVYTTESGYFKGYRIDLTPYKIGYKAVYFRGANYGVSSQVVRGYIVDDDGVVESWVENIESNTNGWQTLPITANSNTLVATSCFSSSGGEVWTPEFVMLIANDGLILNEIEKLKNTTEANTEAFSALDDDINGSNKTLTVAIPAGVYNPARYDGSDASSTYKGYKVDLSSYRGEYDFVEFTGANFSSSNSNDAIIRGLILDVDGNVESKTVNVEARSIGIERLPLTERSATLWASYVTDTSVVADAYKELAVKPSDVTLIKDRTGLTERVEALENLGLEDIADDVNSLSGTVDVLTENVTALERNVGEMSEVLISTDEIRETVTITEYKKTAARIADENATPLTMVQSSSGYFLAYKIDLTPYRGKYDKVFFRGSNYNSIAAGTNVIVRGMIVLDDGVTVESYVPIADNKTNGWQELPITENSATLWANYCKETTGGEVWYPYAETDATDITDYVELIKDPVVGLSERVEALEKLGLEDIADDVNSLLGEVEALSSEVNAVSGVIVGANEELEITDFVTGQLAVRLDFSTTPPTAADSSSGYFAGYKVDLTKYREKYNFIYFRGANYGVSGSLVRGYIVDDDGVVESWVENIEANSNGWQELPITEKSAALRASYCTSASGGEVWTPEKVVLRRRIVGMSDRIDSVEADNDSLATSIDELSAKVDYLEETGGLQQINIHLPDDLYVLSGRVTQLFFRGFIQAVNPYNYDIKVMCQYGKLFPRYLEFSDTTPIGDYPLRIQIRDNNRKIIADEECTLHVVNVPTGLSKNILCCGASATQTGRWPGELKRLLTTDNPNVNFVGRKPGSDEPEVMLEATGGWTWSSFITSGQTAIRFYVTSAIGNIGYGTKLLLGGKTYIVLEVNLTEGVGNIRCQPPTSDDTPSVESGTLVSDDGSATLEFSSWVSEKFIPFYNSETEAIDFKTYADKYCNGKIDVIVMHVGVNSMIWEAAIGGISSIIATARKFIDGFLNDFPDGKLIFAAIPMPDYGSNVYGMSSSVDWSVCRYGTLTAFMLYNTAMYELSQTDEYKGKVFFAPSNMFFDTDYGYPKTTKNVNTRISKYTEVIDTNGMHPIAEGSYMIADGVLPIFSIL